MYLLDTNALSQVLKKRPDTLFLSRLRACSPDSLHTSCVCVMEMRHGAFLLDDGEPLWRRIEKDVLPRIDVLGFGWEEALLAGDVMASLHRSGRMIDVEDVMIGATALRRHLTVVTNNIRHFGRIPGLTVEDWLAA